MKTLSLKTLLFLLFTSMSYTILAQSPAPAKGGKKPAPVRKQESMESKKITFITSKLALSPEEAQAFWPVYNQYQGKLKELNKKQKQEGLNPRQGNIDSLPDKQVELLLNNELSMKQKELDLQKEYNTLFKTILPIKKVAKLYAAEEQFTKMAANKQRNRPPVKEAPQDAVPVKE